VVRELTHSGMAKLSAWRQFSNYLRHDFREIVWPRSMPDPPGTRYITELSLTQHAQVWREAMRAYADGWRWYHGEPEAEKAKRRAEEKAARGEEDARARRGDGDGPDLYEPSPDDDATIKDEFGRIMRVGQQAGKGHTTKPRQHFPPIFALARAHAPLLLTRAHVRAPS